MDDGAGLEIDQKAMDALMRTLNAATGELVGICRLSTLAGATVLEEAVRANMSLPKVTPDELEEQDNPFARRHGEVILPPGYSKPYQIEQSQALLGALMVYQEDDYTDAAAAVLIDEQAAGPQVNVIKGTKVLLPRDVIWETAKEEPVGEAMLTEVANVLINGMFGWGTPSTPSDEQP